MERRLIFKLNTILNYIGIAVMLFVMMITVIDISGRYFFNRPLAGTMELTELSLVIIVYLTLGYAEHFHEHVVIDTIYNLMPRNIQKFMYILGSLISLVTAVLLSYYLYLYAGKVVAGGYKTGVLGIRYYPVIYIASAGAACYALAIISNLCEFIKKEGNDKQL
ncbi:TRAP-type C4-dicarboxylate transport system, small permease component [Caldanaerovirga acetigignens]|uniref:TRAP-type C4-dicarboxylate transport system, small permease component n=1 Tax=Caldanaerovirga acetigignens TaxID=447595 RepID=A0A1M7I9K7_9FIRM|nr:TRAP transporter small permease [Caldanaerovirga acetigignens]SHM37434.1 TRAP-type C4-dicarboxylate transport system, small permease component [Caldanaerovirga acetigignens]